MAMALMMMLMVGLFLTAWVSLLTTRAHQASLQETVVKRRISVRNSDELQRGFFGERVFAGTAPSDYGQTLLLDSNWGGMEKATGWSGVSIYESLDTPATLATVFPYNSAGFRPGGTFIVTEKVTNPPRPAFSGDPSLDEPVPDDFNAYAFLKSAPPPLMGDLFCVYRKPDDAVTQIDVVNAGPELHNRYVVSGRTIIRHPASLFAPSTPNPVVLPFRSNSLYLQDQDESHRIYGTNQDGESLLPSNLPVMKSTTGPLPAGSTSAVMHAGYLDVIRNDSHPGNSLWHFMERESSAGRTDYQEISTSAVTGASGDAWWIEEQSDPTYKPPAWPRGYPPTWKVLFVQLDHAGLKHLRILGVIDQIVFIGQNNAANFTNAGLMTPIMITVVPNGDRGRNTIDFRFIDENNRRIVLGVEDWNATTLNMYWEGNPIAGGTTHRWRSVLINEYRTMIANLPVNVTRNVRIIGGLMTNWTFKRKGAGSVARLTFARDVDFDPAGAAGPSFATLIPRDAWMESYFLPVPPP